MNAETVNAGSSPVERGVRPDPERAAFERWCVQRWSGDRNALGRNGDDHPKHPSEYTMGNIEFAWQAWQAGRESARARFRDALWETYKMIDPIRPPGTPGSYARGEHNGIAAALQTLKENLNREMP